MQGIAEMFAELDGYERYEVEIEQWGHERRSAHAERMAEFRRCNPHKVRAELDAQKRYRKAQGAVYAAKSLERVRAWRKANPERARALSRSNTRAWRAREAQKKAA